MIIIMMIIFVMMITIIIIFIIHNIYNKIFDDWYNNDIDDENDISKNSNDNRSVVKHDSIDPSNKNVKINNNDNDNHC